MKLLSSQQLQETDAYTIRHEPIASIDLMERASIAFVEAFLKQIQAVDHDAHVSIFCGTGNNGGDGLAIARLLANKKWTVACYLVHFSDAVSADNKINQERLKASGVTIHPIVSGNFLPKKIHSIVIDALVGTGISRPLEGLLGEVVEHINCSEHSCVCSVDLPSGLYDRGDCSSYLKHIIHADYTFTFQCPKRNFLLSDYATVVGQWHVLDIGLDEAFIDTLTVSESLTTMEEIRLILKQRSSFSHKGTFGHAALFCGSKGMIGAAVLSTKACLRSGAGLTTIHAPECGYPILQTACPEAMCMSVGENTLERSSAIEKFSAVGIGPGIGQSAATKKLLLELIQTCRHPMVLDADALNLLKESDLSLLPAQTIITPHVKEFARLFGDSQNATERLTLAREKGKELGIYILLKGKYSSIICPDGTLIFNSTGNAGMAKGGSGDVLTGLLTGLLARGYTPKNVCILGCYLHGLAGDLAAKNVGMETMTASDIISHLSEAFQLLYQNNR